MKKAIKIDVEAQTLSYIQLSDDFRDISKSIGNGCELFCCPVEFENRDTIYADDESLLRVEDIVGGFIMPEWSYPLVGNAIILGTDDEGESIDAKTTIEELIGQMKFLDKEVCLKYAEIVRRTPPQIYTF